ncbi:MAG TPA: flagellar export chaperone FliS [Armatimonadota bacterium]|nr:flagellar export chaperone FliS [Armatimonadota bacterium]
MNPQRLLSRYQESRILNASREQLLLLTYDGLLRFLGRARRGIEAHDYEEKHVGFSRAEAIILELHRTLDFSAASELAGNLARIYSYLLEELAHADSGDDEARVQGVIEAVTELRNAWAEAAGRAAAGAQEGG